MPHLDGLFVEGDAEVGPGDVAQRRQLAELPFRRGDGRGPLVGLSHIQRRKEGAAPGLDDLGDNLRTRFLVDVGDADGGSFGGKQFALCAAHAACAARDDCYFARQSLTHRCPPV